MTERLAPDRLMGERIGGRFIIERLIGAGPLSSAFRARDELLQRRVTVKLFHPSHADDAVVVDAQLELAKAVARLSHPNIVTVIDRGEHEGMPFIVLEYVRGENLQERIDRFAPLQLSEVAAHGTSLARALSYAHAQDVVHGNLRPGNVLVSEEREVKLVDFGGGSFVASLTGVDAYLAPELRADPLAAASDPANDIYALGVLLFVALTEELPGTAVDAGHVQLLRPDVSPRLAAIVARTISAWPEDRYETMHELASDLAAVRVPTDRGGSRVAGVTGDPDATGLMPVVGDEYEDDPGATGVLVPSRADTRALERRGRPERIRSPRQTRARVVAWSMVLVPLLALTLVGVMIAGERGNDTVRTNDEGAPKGVPVRLEVVEAASFDPAGDKEEHESEVPNLTDGDLDTAWQTEHYGGSPSLSDHKAGASPSDKGVGFYVTLGAPSDVTAMRFSTDLEGWTATIYGADQPAPRLDDWEPVSDPTPIEDGADVPVSVGAHEYTTYLVWITTLSIDTDGEFRSRVHEVEVFGTSKDPGNAVAPVSRSEEGEGSESQPTSETAG